MDLQLKNKNVIVTGGSKGIGRAIALAFADEGANVAICARGVDALTRTRDEITARGVKAFAASCDVGDA
ncbi:MAG: SDR family NAD(P)-dependent oxidoreductase, partial [Casimicrobium sp.]